MGLRVNTNTTALTALRNLREADRAQARSLERLSTGLRINSAADDPSGLVVSEQFRAQIGSLKQALENTEFGANLLGTAEAALTEVSSLLIGIRESVIFALNTGGASVDQIAAEQDSVDSAVLAIDRVSGTTRYGRTGLLNGTSSFVTSTVSSFITDLTLRTVFFGTGETTKTFTATVASLASRGGLSISSFGATSGIIRITGSLGTEDILVLPGLSVSGAINAVRDFTGIYASGGFAFTEARGSTERVTVSVVRGAYLGSTGTDFGTNLGVTVSGAPVAANGLNIRVDGSFLKAELTFSSAVGVGTTAAFTVKRSGLNFQLNTEAVGHDSIRFGLPSVDSSFLGKPATARGAAGGLVGGFLASIISGAENDLTKNPSNALRIVDQSIDEINRLRGFLGALEQQNLEPNARSLGIALENLIASNSEIRDLDFAAETAEFTRAQVLFAAGTSVLASANLIPQTVLTLLR